MRFLSLFNKLESQEISSTVEALPVGDVSIPKTLSPRYLSDTAATAVSSLSIPLSTLIGIETKNSLKQAARKNTFLATDLRRPLWGNSRPPRQSQVADCIFL